MNPLYRQMQRLLQQIQQLEPDQLSVQHLADCCALSRWQLQRAFLAATGMNLSNHLQHHRLSRAAEQLINSREGVLEIAVASGFSSQEAFSRAFKVKFGYTPGQYRRRNILDGVSVDLFIPENKTWRKVMNIEVKTKPALHLHGVYDYFNGHGMENANNFEKIPPLWNRFNAQVARQRPNGISSWYGYIFDSDQPVQGNLCYLASYNAGDHQFTLENERYEVVAEQLYAIVPHHGPLQNLGDTLDAFFGQWLPGSEYRMAADFTVEVYDERFDPLAETNYFETWVPVERL